MSIEPERSILADRDLLAKTQTLYAAADPGSLAQQCYAADIRYLRGLIDSYERSFFDLHGIDGAAQEDTGGG